jgi:hypothetical protein
MFQRQRRTGAEESDSDVERETSSSTNTLSAQEASSSSGSSEASSSDEGEPGSWCQERLLFEFLESEPPYHREPLADKVYICISDRDSPCPSLTHHAQESFLLV